MKNSSDAIGNRTRDLPAGSAVSTNCATAYPNIHILLNESNDRANTIPQLTTLTAILISYTHQLT